MRFVKASIKLPPHDKDVHIEVYGKIGYGRYLENRTPKIFWYQTYAEIATLTEDLFDRIQWLDKDEQDEGWVPVEQFADFLDTERNKGLDGRGKESLWNDMKIWGKTTAFKLMLEKFKDRQPPVTT